MAKERLFGVGEPLVQRERDQGIPADAYVDLIDGLGCRAYRSWMHITEILKDPETPDEEALNQHKRLLKRCRELDIEVTGMSHEWFLPAGCIQKTGHAVPERDLGKGSLYMQTMEMLERSWETMASLFPEVSIWEVGNEWNLNAFLHPDGFMQTDMTHPFTPSEKYDIALDMMYFAARGIRKGNKHARVASFSPALSTPSLGGGMPDFFPVMYGVAWAFNELYTRISEGKTWSKDPDDFFDIAAWHPYVFTTKDVPDKDLFLDVEEPDTLWRDYNDAAYRVMKKFGDSGKEVILTETGFTDCGNREWEERYALYNKKIMAYAKEMSYVRTLHNFRLLNENSMLKRDGIDKNQIGGLTEVYFGLFTDPEDGCQPRARAKAIQEMTGKNVDLSAAGRKISEMRY